MAKKAKQEFTQEYIDELLKTVAKKRIELGKRLENKEPYDETLQKSRELNILINICHKHNLHLNDQCYL